MSVVVTTNGPNLQTIPIVVTTTTTVSTDPDTVINGTLQDPDIALVNAFKLYISQQIVAFGGSQPIGMY